MKEVRLIVSNGGSVTKEIRVLAASPSLALLRWHESPAGRDFLKRHVPAGRVASAKLARESAK